MDFVFISHRNTEKKRIRVVVDELLRAGITPWIDRPEEMGYTATEIEDRIAHIRPGEDYTEAISRAASSAVCVLLFASSGIEEPHRELWHQEITLGHSRGTLLVVRLEDVELSKIPLPFGIDVSRLQRMDVILPPTADFDRLDASQRDGIQRLINEVKAKITRVKNALYGTFNRAGAAALRSGPTAEQLDKFMMLLDREAETTVIASSGSVTVLSGGSAARADYLIQRMPELELPCRAHKAALAPQSNLQDLRADVIRGAVDVHESRWLTEIVPWTASPSRGGDFARKMFVNAVLERLSLAGGGTPQSPADLAKVLQQQDVRVVLHTSFADTLDARRNNRQLVRDVSAWFAGAPADRFRLLVHMSPLSSWLDLLRKPDAWLHRECKACGAGIVDLPEVMRTDLHAWHDIMSLVLDETKPNIANAIDEAFAPNIDAARRSIRSLDQHLRPKVTDWRMREPPRASAHSTQHWQDHDVQAI